MTLAGKIDQLVDALNRRRMGDEYEPDSSPPWTSLVEEWAVFKLLVDTLDYAVRNPFAKRSPLILAMAAAVLQGQDAAELCAALSDAGEALGFAAAFPQSSATGERP